MQRRLLIYLFSVCFLGFTSAHGNDIFEKIIRMESGQYRKHYKQIVIFPHHKHVIEFGIACGECHHDADGEPIDNLEISDDVESCIECHFIASYVTGKPETERLEYHTNALHLKCKGCHKLYNKRNGLGSLRKKQAPIKCYQCH